MLSHIAHSLEVKKGLNGRRTEYEDGILTIFSNEAMSHWKKKLSLTKEPDFAWGFCKPSPGKAMSHLSPVPGVVLEAGFSETLRTRENIIVEKSSRLLSSLCSGPSESASLDNTKYHEKLVSATTPAG